MYTFTTYLQLLPLLQLLLYINANVIYENENNAATSKIFGYEDGFCRWGVCRERGLGVGGGRDDWLTTSSKHPVIMSRTMTIVYMWDKGYSSFCDMMDMIGCSKEIRRSPFFYANAGSSCSQVLG